MKIVFAVITLSLFPYILRAMSNELDMHLEEGLASCSWCNKTLADETTPLREQQPQYCIAAWNKDFPQDQCLHCNQHITEDSLKKYVYCQVGTHFKIHQECEQEFIDSLSNLHLCSLCRKKISVKFPGFFTCSRERFLKCTWLGFYLSALIGGALTTYIFVVWDPSAPTWMTNLIE